MRSLPLLALVLLAPAAAPAAAAQDVCVLYAYVADYNWYYACARTSPGACQAYLKEEHATWETRDCVGPYPLDPRHPPQSACGNASGDDYPWWVCVRPASPGCAAWVHLSDPDGAETRCVGLP